MRPLGRWLVGREARAYAQLNGLDGVPRYLGHSGASLMLEYVEALPLPEADPAQLQPAFFAELSALVEAIHARGVAHADLTCPNNILVTPAGRPVVLDFAAAIVESRCPFTKLLMLLLREQDRRGIAKAKQLYAPSLLTPEEKALLQRGQGLVAFVRVLMGAVRWLLRGLAAKPRRARRRAGGGVRTTRR